jgi:uncharacterized protein with GYD domain
MDHPKPASKKNCKAKVNDDTQITNLKEKFIMATFILLTRISSISIPTPRASEDLKRKVMDRVRAECPRAEWIQKFAVIGPYDYLDIFWAPDMDTAFKVATIIRSYGNAQAEIWPATEWEQFKEMVTNLTSSEGKDL